MGVPLIEGNASLVAGASVRYVRDRAGTGRDRFRGRWDNSDLLSVLSWGIAETGKPSTTMASSRLGAQASRLVSAASKRPPTSRPASTQAATLWRFVFRLPIIASPLPVTTSCAGGPREAPLGRAIIDRGRTGTFAKSEKFV